MNNLFDLFAGCVAVAFIIFGRLVGFTTGDGE